MYKTVFILAYYGLLRIGEVSSGSHPLKAKDVHVGQNKDKILLFLCTSKTHGKESYLQKIKIDAVQPVVKQLDGKRRYFCPFTLTRNYSVLHGEYDEDSKPFFIF